MLLKESVFSYLYELVKWNYSIRNVCLTVYPSVRILNYYRYNFCIVKQRERGQWAVYCTRPPLVNLLG